MSSCPTPDVREPLFTADLLLLLETLELDLCPLELEVFLGRRRDAGTARFMTQAASSAASRTIQFSSDRQAATGDSALARVLGPDLARRAMDSKAHTAIWSEEDRLRATDLNSLDSLFSIWAKGKHKPHKLKP